jgi:hypothetical protein
LTDARCPARGHHRLLRWILLLGDSGANRGMYCHLYALLVAGTERTPVDNVYYDAENDAETIGCGGLVPKTMFLSYPHAVYDFNTTHERRFSASKETNSTFHFHVRLGGGAGRVRVSWAYTKGLVAEAGTFDDAIATAIASATSDGPAVPDEVAIGAGIWDYLHLTWSDDSNRFNFSQLDETENIGIAELRREGALRLLALTRNATGGAARFWYRNNHCQSRFPAAHSDVRVEPAVLAAGGGLLETLNFSAGYWRSQNNPDGFHYDLEPWANHRLAERNEPEKMHVGEVVSQAAQSMLGRLCREA